MLEKIKKLEEKLSQSKIDFDKYADDLSKIEKNSNRFRNGNGY